MIIELKGLNPKNRNGEILKYGYNAEIFPSFWGYMSDILHFNGDSLLDRSDERGPAQTIWHLDQGATEKAAQAIFNKVENGQLSRSIRNSRHNHNTPPEKLEEHILWMTNLLSNIAGFLRDSGGAMVIFDVRD